MGNRTPAAARSQTRGRTAGRLYPGLVTVATRKGHAAPLAVWHLARALDTRGAGRVLLGDLRGEGMKLWSRSKTYSAIREAARLGLVAVVTRRRDGARVVTLRSLAHVAKVFNIADLGARPVLARVSALRTAATFKAAVFSAFHAGRKGDTARPISRQTLQTLTGIGRRTQARYERRNNDRHNGQVRRRANFAVLAQGPEALPGARENVHGACYTYGGAVVRPMPNSYTSTLATVSGSKLRKMNLKGGLVDSGAGQHKARVFFPDAKSARKAASREQEQGKPTGLQPAVSQRFYRDRLAYRGAGVWRAC
jgi:hypothetical protein